MSEQNQTDTVKTAVQMSRLRIAKKEYSSTSEKSTIKAMFGRSLTMKIWNLPLRWKPPQIHPFQNCIKISTVEYI